MAKWLDFGPFVRIFLFSHQGLKFCITGPDFFLFYHTACTTQLTVSISFGGPLWPISIEDLSLGSIGGGQCVGTIFDIGQRTDVSPQNAPAWIVGDTFLVRFFLPLNFTSLTP
jgi:hypothetical protein